MPTKRTNGLQLDKMLRNGLENLRLREEEINRLNVFPVADGDTGTNMRLTLENGLRAAHPRAETALYLEELANGMLLGARGNSGVILSQFFRGFAEELSRCATLGPGEWRSGLIRGYRCAYKAVIQPAEGTILSVTREGIEHIRGHITRSTTIEMLLAMYIGEMQKTLSYTPEMLPVLKEAGVVDSGAMGFITIVEGMLMYLNGEILEETASANLPAGYAAAGAPLDLTLFNENSAFEDGYCMEFILQLMNAPKYNQHFRVNTYIEDMKLLGNSLVVVQDNKRVKVHIHTLHPARIIALSQDFGEFLTFKLENMQVQHNEHVRKLNSADKPKKLLGVVAVVNGDGMRTVFEELGCDAVIEGGKTMNTSSQEFLDAFAQVNADYIVVLPNDRNTVPAAEQAASICGPERITVLPTASCAEGYFALAMDVQDSSDVEYRIGQMRQGAENVVTVSEATASRDYSYHELRCRTGDELVLIDNEIVCVGSRWIDALLEGIGKIPDLDDMGGMIVFRGSGVSEEAADELAERLEERWPLLEAEFVYGGQEVYHWVIGIS